jgi:hydrogenase maturation factor
MSNTVQSPLSHLSESTEPVTGMMHFIRYAFMPNRLRYCGGDDNLTLFEYGVENVVDGGLPPLLQRFTGAMPYLRLIAHSNGIADPFDWRVVEAYWIGNELLDRVEVRQLHEALLERYGKQLTPKIKNIVLGKAPAGARPHHSFHVFDVHSRVGELANTLETMDHCRISWGKVSKVEGPEILVEREPLIIRDGKLTLGAAQVTRAARQVDGKGFIHEVREGDWVSLHWGWACEVLSQRRLANLKRYSAYHLALANQTM